MKGAGFTRGSRLIVNRKKFLPNPGPASYNLKFYPKVRRGSCAVIGTAARTIGLNLYDSPGPSKYHFKKKPRGKGVKICQSLRQDVAKRYFYKPGPKYYI